MLKILLESLLMECAEQGLNTDKEINHLYDTLNGSFLTDLQKEIRDNNIGIQELKLMACEIVNSEDFQEELNDLGITIALTENKENETLTASEIRSQILEATGVEIETDFIMEYIKEEIEENGDINVSCYSINDTIINEETNKEYEITYNVVVDYNFNDDEELESFDFNIIWNYLRCSFCIYDYHVIYEIDDINDSYG